MDQGAPAETLPIDRDEWILRRIRAQYVDLGKGLLLPYAFAPDEKDEDGLSVVRERFHSISALAGPLRGTQGKAASFVGVLCAGDVLDIGLSIVPRPIEGIEGHCVIPELNANTRKSDLGEHWKAALVKQCVEVHGPFPPYSGTPVIAGGPPLILRQDLATLRPNQ